MPSQRGASNKAKIARRVIEVLEFFDNEHPEATVMDIVRRYNRPQSSTSELLSSLVEMGLLYKDAQSRSYSPTQRAALLGSGGQPATVSDGSLVRLLDRLDAQTGLPAALIGMTGLNAQIFAWRAGSGSAAAATRHVFGGLQEPLSGNAAGWLLLSTIPAGRRSGALRRLNAEAAENAKFVHAEMEDRLRQFADSRTAHGPAGFGSSAALAARLLPGQPEDRPLAVALLHDRSGQLSLPALDNCIEEAVRACCQTAAPPPPSLGILASAA